MFDIKVPEFEKEDLREVSAEDSRVFVTAEGIIYSPVFLAIGSDIHNGEWVWAEIREDGVAVMADVTELDVNGCREVKLSIYAGEKEAR